MPEPGCGRIRRLGSGRKSRMHVGMNRVMTPVWVHEVGEEPRHGGHLLALAVPVAEAAVGEEARPTRARERRAQRVHASAARCLPAGRGGRRCPRRDGDLVRRAARWFVGDGGSDR